MDRGELHKLIEEVTVQVGERLARRDGGRRRDKAHVVLLPAPAALKNRFSESFQRSYDHVAHNRHILCLEGHRKIVGKQDL